LECISTDALCQGCLSWTEGIHNMSSICIRVCAHVRMGAGGEGIYRVAIDPTPKMQYLLNHERSSGFSELPA